MDSIKVLHTGDVHLGYEDMKVYDVKGDYLYESEKIFGNKVIEDDIKQTFIKIIDICRYENVDIMLIAGDLFDNDNPSDKLVDFVIEEFDSINDTIIMISPGNHDYYIKYGCYDKISASCENVFVFDGKMDYYEINIGNNVVRIYGAGFTDSVCTESLMKQRDISEEDVINLGVFHGTVEGQKSNNPYNPISSKQIENNAFDYLALGHIHKQTKVLRRGLSNYAYCGCPQGMSFGMKGPKGIYLGIVSHGYASMKFVEICKRRYEEISINVNELKHNLTVINAGNISAIIEKYIIENFGEKYKDNIYRIVLTGLLSGKINENAIKRELSELYYVEIDNRCVAETDKNNLLSGAFLYENSAVYDKQVLSSNNKKFTSEKSNKFILKSIYIGNFGGLKKYNLEFTDGFNIIYGKNEFGKSTIMAFIKMMLYGCSSKSKDISQNLRRKYQPFDKSQMCGNMRFMIDGKEYLLEKEFGKSPAFDVRHIYNEAGREIVFPKEYEVGEYFLGLDEEEFNKTIFAGVEGRYQGGELSEKMLSKITNIAAGLKEDDTAINDLENINKEMEKLKSKRGTSGKIIEVSDEIDEITEEIERLKEERNNLRSQRREENSMKKREKVILEEVIEGMEELGSVEKNSRKKYDVENRKREKKYNKAKRQYYISVLFVVISVISGIYSVKELSESKYFNKILLTIGIILIFLIVKLLIEKRMMKMNSYTFEEEYEEKYERINVILDKLGYNGYSLRKLKNRLEEIERQLENDTSETETKIIERIERYKAKLETAGKRKIELGNAYQKLAEERKDVLERIRLLQDVVSMPLNNRMVELMSDMCGEKYDSIIIGEKGALKVKKSGESNYYEWKYLSTATAVQVYLALRLSLCEFAGNDKMKLPVLLDDILDVCDDERIYRTINVLKAADTQVIMFTCHNNIYECGRLNI